MIKKIIVYYIDVIKLSGRWIGLASLILLAGTIAGFLAVKLDFRLILDVLGEATEMLEQMAEDIEEVDTWGRIMTIFKNNLLAIGFMLFFGFFSLGYIPIASMFINGAMVSAIITLAVQDGEDLFSLLMMIAPHGIVEIPAAILACAFGLKLSWEWLLPSARDKRIATLNRNVLQAVAMFVLLVILVFIAAVIETFLINRVV